MTDASPAKLTGGGVPGGSPYNETIAAHEVDMWKNRAAQGLKIIPTVSTGWDNRPRINTWPWPWTNGSTTYVTDPTTAKLERPTADGLAFVRANPKAVETNMLMLSAWNEHDEGHWIEPGLHKYGRAEKLEAIKRAIDAQKRNDNGAVMRCLCGQAGWGRPLPLARRFAASTPTVLFQT